MSELTYPAKVATTTSQPKAGIEMNITGPNPQAQQRQQCENQSHKVSRLRGGGAGKDCFLGMIGCCLCFEVCEGCCDCIADIICCPCEMCC
ncbi:hypothetical protein PM082_016913 [Marasmius tenuissimus]|nr:hypothetical protein PM082_016913 [Marasmius tenuissimus]